MDLYTLPGEQPLDHLISDGGYVGIFRKIACIGDSLSSGEFEGKDDAGNNTYHDMYEYSWGQFIARTAGCQVYNFSRGGMSAKWYLDSFADERGLWNLDLASQAYIVALGVNDVSMVLGGQIEFGSLDDVDWNDRRNNKRTFVGDYVALLQRYHEIAPKAFFFLMTMPSDDAEPARDFLYEQHRELLLELARRMPNTFVLDLRRYGPVYDEEFRRNFYMGGHLNPMGYALTAKLVISYIDFIIRSDMPRFAEVGFINTPFSHKKD